MIRSNDKVKMILRSKILVSTESIWFIFFRILLSQFFYVDNRL